MKRLGIFVFYDKDGIVDDYVIFLLECIQSFLEGLVIVCNGKLNKEGKVRLSRYTDLLYIRKNEGYDAMAFKLALTDYLGWERVLEYDEVLLLNDTFYGPLYPFQEMFDTMQRREVDFWGITCQRESADYFSYNQKIIPAYIQSFFCAFRKAVLRHPSFQEYWNRFDSTEWIFSDVVNRHEKAFTKKLEDLGFRWDVYIREPLFESDRPEQNFSQYYYIAYQMIRDRRCPVIKRKNFIRKHLTESYGSSGEDITRALQYIESETSYDTDMIWDNLLRLYDIGDIHKTLNLNYILPCGYKERAGGAFQNAAAIVWLSGRRYLDECREYLARISAVMDVYVMSDSRDVLHSLQSLPSSVHLERMLKADTDEVYRILLQKALTVIHTSAYLVFLQDMDCAGASGSKTPASKLQEYADFRNMWSNLVESAQYVQEVCRLFEQNPRMGLLAVPRLVTGTAFGSLGNQWNGELESVRRILEDARAGRYISEHADCISHYHAFWCRTRALEPYIEYLIHIKPGYRTETIAKCYPYLVQASGYYTGTVMNQHSAAVLYTNMQQLLGRILKQARLKYDFTDFDSYLDGDMLLYCSRFEQVMVYGAGENGYRAACLLKKHGMPFAGYIVSDGHLAEGCKYGDPLIAVSSLPKGADRLGIVVSVANPKFQAEIAENLKEQGYQDIYIL